MEGAVDDLPDEVREIRRLTLKPGDALVVRADRNISAETATEIKQRLCTSLGLGDDTRILVLGGMDLDILETPPEPRNPYPG